MLAVSWTNHANIHAQYTNMQSHYANMCTQYANKQAQYASRIQNMQHASTICQHAYTYANMWYVVQHAVMHAQDACATCMREVLSIVGVSTHPPAYHCTCVFRSTCQSLQIMASFGCVSGRSPLWVMRSYVSSLVVDITFTLILL